MIITLPKIFGILGMLIISVAILTKNPKKRNIMFAVGGGGLLYYSIAIKDIIFTLLQILFIASSIWELSTLKNTYAHKEKKL